MILIVSQDACTDGISSERGLPANVRVKEPLKTRRKYKPQQLRHTEEDERNPGPLWFSFILNVMDFETCETCTKNLLPYEAMMAFSPRRFWGGLFLAISWEGQQVWKVEGSETGHFSGPWPLPWWRRHCDGRVGHRKGLLTNGPHVETKLNTAGSHGTCNHWMVKSAAEMSASCESGWHGCRGLILVTGLSPPCDRIRLIDVMALFWLFVQRVLICIHNLSDILYISSIRCIYQISYCPLCVYKHLYIFYNLTLVWQAATMLIKPSMHNLPGPAFLCSAGKPMTTCPGKWPKCYSQHKNMGACPLPAS